MMRVPLDAGFFSERLRKAIDVMQEKKSRSYMHQQTTHHTVIGGRSEPTVTVGLCKEYEQIDTRQR
jgi:hypothetical protein